MGSDYDNLRLFLTAFDRETEELVLEVDIDQLWPRLWEVGRISQEQAVLPGELSIERASATALLEAIGSQAPTAEADYFIAVRRVAGPHAQLTPLRLLQHKGGGIARTSCDPGLWEPVYYPPARYPGN